MITTSDRHGYFAPVNNRVFLDKSLSSATRQILLEIELRAGKSRLAKLTPSSLADITSFSKRTALRAVRELIERGWLERTNENWLRLTQPQPESHFVQVFEGVVWHSTWKVWQKHLLLFLLSQFRSSDREFGVSYYSLNLRGRKGHSIERCCRVPGKNPQDRRSKVRAFIGKLEADGIIRIVREASSQRPAICTIAREALEKLPTKTNRTVRNDGLTEPSESDKPNRAGMTNQTVRWDKPNRAEMTNRTDVEDSKESENKPASVTEPPVPPLAARGDSRRDEGGVLSNSDPSPESLAPGAGKPEGIAHRGLAPLMNDPRRRRLTKEIEDHCLGGFLKDSHENARRLAQKWATVLDQLPEDVQASDVIQAITSKQFEGITSLSWGLLLSRNFIARFAIEIRSSRQSRQRADNEINQSLQRICLRLDDPDPTVRLDAVERLSSSHAHNRKVPGVLARRLSGIGKEGEASVRITILRQLSILAAHDVHRDRVKVLKGIISQMTKDEDQEVREEARCLIYEMAGKA